MSYSIYTPNVSDAVTWQNEQAALSIPNIQGNSGKILTSNGTALAYLDFSDASISNLESYATAPAFPVSGESAVLYFAQDTAKWYRWSGSYYADIHADLLHLAGGTMSGVLNMGGWDIEDAANVRASGVYDTTGGNMCLQWQPIGNYLKLNDDTRIANLQATTVKHQSAAVNQLTFSAGPDTVAAGCPLAMGGFDISNAGIVTGTRLRGPLYYNTTKYLEYTGTYIDTFNIPISTGVTPGSYVQTAQLRSNDWANGAGTSLITSNGTNLVHYQHIDMGNRDILACQTLDVDSVYNVGGGTRSFYIDATTGVFTPTTTVNFNNQSGVGANALSCDSVANKANTATMLNFTASNVHCSAPLVITSGLTAARPSANLVDGMTYFDKTINKPIWYHGGNWVDATGTVV